MLACSRVVASRLTRPLRDEALVVRLLARASGRGSGLFGMPRRAPWARLRRNVGRTLRGCSLGLECEPAVEQHEQERKCPEDPVVPSGRESALHERQERERHEAPETEDDG